MPLLKHSKSQKHRSGIEDESVAEHPPALQNESTENKRISRFDRPQSIFRRSKSAPEDATPAEDSSLLNNTTDTAGGLETLAEADENYEGGEAFQSPAAMQTSLPTPTQLPLPPKSATFYRSHSPLHGSDTESIGIMLGSPRRPPLYSGRTQSEEVLAKREMKRRPHPNRATTTAATVQPPSSFDHMLTPPQTPEARKKKQSWKALGGLFQRGQSKPKISTPPSDGSTTQRNGMPAPSPASLQNSSSTPRTPFLSRNMARIEARHEAERSSSSVATSHRFHASRHPPRKQSLQPKTHDQISTGTSSNVPGAVPRPPKLDLEIPNAEMERYSVMFEKLLEPRQSILERRQSKARMLEPNVDKSLPKRPQASGDSVVPQRSVTSPHLRRNFPLKIKVADDQDTEVEEPPTAVHQPRSLQRSMTSPPNTMSPMMKKSSRPKPPTLSSTESDRSPNTPLSDENSLPPTPMTVTTVTDDESFALTSHEPLPSAKSRQKAEEAGRRYEIGITRTAHEKSPARDPYERVKSPEDLDRQVVQVSVARQVSVGRARRQVEQATNSAKQPLRPRVVELGKHRKSTMVLIESGDE
ncbi:hypothetical protein KC343_g13849 [Hortaea werneckii]|uniref:Uncharacterized protein n=1 Tax=Hortaea werneckii TaxID=91943 RepID=A0A3M7HDM0_HORWE|nr:hypothetical protein KC352_g26855 [Hortaea werneckii]KAI7543993.1 hypothetical protein KC317_g16134 [Hortaea werneckii]KAI7599463.1 hypothetical protein KC346_g13721 [Hortaea werneckii]KAI7605127.1 hypothetical protein KC343_g13849 [Hortaea werneckii]KAI7637549.1 hypothetical protein KC319_g15012 [Hortaea werneckii]